MKSLETWISEQNDSALWGMLADLGGIMGRLDPDKKDSLINDPTLYILLGKKVTDELDKRLYEAYEQ